MTLSASMVLLNTIWQAPASPFDRTACTTRLTVPSFHCLYHHFVLLPRARALYRYPRVIALVWTRYISCTIAHTSSF
jgi:hypothetical protein